MTGPAGILLTRSRSDARADVRIAIPPVNVLGPASLVELAGRIAAARPARVVVLTGLPRAFSAGVDVAAHAPEPGAMDQMLSAMREVLTALLETPAVTLASVSGACLGGGAEIVAACDLVLASDDARIGFPEIRLACFPPGAAVLLPLRLGDARAADWILTGRVVSGREAAEAGLVSRSVPPHGLEAETDALAERILSAAPAALAEARDLLRRRRRLALTRDLPDAEAAYRRLAGDADLARAVAEWPKK